MKKLLDALLMHQIDSYYLLMVKLEIQQQTTCVVHFVDMLDYLDHVTFDSGPGQIMLKARSFFTARSIGRFHHKELSRNRICLGLTRRR